ncbi:transglycosylase SLT domain-containing protein [Cytobacillus oceanisediminis]|uniref:transglycosylase SLT domain-containing protein n=1 Tax=Cytobacillus oceanisediminis TaxID=665099 RepID=UPI001FB243EC|nr:transglycosylase SLT domain-containing protein [Cytobacillus oceanisediminis]UOE58078.1 transglycosylase SLT domain-containing protein [Cytobacillus oceanisediminis]
MADKDKQQYNKDSYVKKLKEAKKSYEERKSYLKEFSLKKKKKSSSSASGGEDTGVANIQLHGEMPTIAKYKGPDNYYDKIIGENYQTGLKAKLAGTDKWNDAIFEQAGKAGVNPLLVKIIMATETGGKHSSKPNAYNCVGLMQVEYDTAKSQGLSWDKVRNDPVYNIYAGCLVIKGKHNYVNSIIKNNGDRYRRYKSQGYELKPNVHGVAWLYNGFSVPSNGSSKVTSGGYIYANQVAAMYKGFGRDPFVDTALTLNSLGDIKVASSSASSSTARSLGGPTMASIKSERDTETSFEAPLRTKDEEEILFLQQQSYSYRVPVGKIKGNYFQAPDYIREKYVSDRKLSRLFAEKVDYAPLPSSEFIHLSGPQENYYAPEAQEVFSLLKARLGYRQLVVARGYEPLGESNDSSHSIGIAMDIFAPTAEEAIRIADTAWLLGVRSIAIGPKFVHVDVGPESVWGYDNLAEYRGPGSVRVGGIQHGYR